MELGLYTIQKSENYGGAIWLCIAYWDTSSLRGEYGPNKIVIKTVIFVTTGTVLLLSANIGKCQTQKFHFPRYLIDGDSVL